MELGLKVIMMGLRGFPGVQGGVETHAENLCPLLVNLGHEVTVLTRSPYQSKAACIDWQGIKFISLWAPQKSGLEAFIHSVLAVFYAAIKRPDILHIHAIGPAIVTPLARLLGLNVVVTHHGPDYDRQKWGLFAKTVLRLGERWGMYYAKERIVISKVIADLVRTKYGMESVLIPNGVNLPHDFYAEDLLNQFNLQSGHYILLVSRMVPEKRHLDLIEAFSKAETKEWKLVLVGNVANPDHYIKSVLDKAKNIKNIVFTGFQSDATLSAIYAHAGFFILPSSHEGLPIAMLEALSHGLPVVASNIPANLEVENDGISYFPLGDIDALAKMITTYIQTGIDHSQREKIRRAVLDLYNWPSIAKNVSTVYSSVKH